MNDFKRMIEKLVDYYVRKRNVVIGLGMTCITSSFIVIGASLPQSYTIINVTYSVLKAILLYFNILLPESTKIIPVEEINYLLFVFGIFVFNLGLSFIFLEKFKFFDKILMDKKIIIKHWSMDSPSFNNLYDMKQNFNLVQFDINLSKYDLNKLMSQAKLFHAVKYQDKIANRIIAVNKRKNRNHIDYSYFSITSLPFVGRLAYQLGDGQKYHFFENRKLENGGFKELDNSNVFPKLLLKEEKYKNVEELILMIGLRSKIDFNEIPFNTNNYSLVYLENEELKDNLFCEDVIKSSLQLTEYRESIKSVIEKSKAKTVHIFYAGVTSLMFSLCSSFSENYGPTEIIVYQYSKKEYKWGIKINERNIKKAIVWIIE